MDFHIVVVGYRRRAGEIIGDSADLERYARDRVLDIPLDFVFAVTVVIILDISSLERIVTKPDTGNLLAIAVDQCAKIQSGVSSIGAGGD